MVREKIVVRHAHEMTVDHIEIHAPDKKTLDLVKRRVTLIITKETRICSGIEASLRILDPSNPFHVEAHIPSRNSSYKFVLTGNIYDILCLLMNPFETHTYLDHERLSVSGWQKTASTTCCVRFSSNEPFKLDVTFRVNPDDPNSVYATLGSFQELRIPAYPDSIGDFLKIAHDVYRLNIEIDQTAAVFRTRDGASFVVQPGKEVDVLRSLVLGMGRR
jgi:hypothetical protein